MSKRWADPGPPWIPARICTKRARGMNKHTVACVRCECTCNVLYACACVRVTLKHQQLVNRSGTPGATCSSRRCVSTQQGNMTLAHIHTHTHAHACTVEVQGRERETHVMYMVPAASLSDAIHSTAGRQACAAAICLRGLGVSGSRRQLAVGIMPRTHNRDNH